MGDPDTVFVQQAPSGDANAVLTLMQPWDPIVWHIAHNYFLKGTQREDLVQEGRIGFFKAIREYREDKAASFRSFAVLCVRSEMISAIKKASRRKHDPLNTSLSLDNPRPNTPFHEFPNKTAYDWIRVRTQGDPLQHLLEQEAWGTFETGMAQVLTPLEREVLLRHVDGQTDETMASGLESYPQIHRQRLATGEGKSLSVFANLIPRQSKLPQTLQTCFTCPAQGNLCPRRFKSRRKSPHFEFDLKLLRFFLVFLGNPPCATEGSRKASPRRSSEP